MTKSHWPSIAEPTTAVELTRIGVEQDGRFALISKHFFYFGRNAIDISEIPTKHLDQSFSKKGLGYRCDFSAEFVEDFASWITSTFKRGIHGPPCKPKSVNPSQTCPRKVRRKQTCRFPYAPVKLRLSTGSFRLRPKQLYSVSVYERFVQSIAIHATQKGKNTIEDINFSPKSVGAFFQFPLARRIKNGPIDAYNVSASAAESRRVDPIDPSDWQSSERPDTGPIKKILRTAQ